jgi:hypothetical protein
MRWTKKEKEKEKKRKEKKRKGKNEIEDCRPTPNMQVLFCFHHVQS